MTDLELLHEYAASNSEDAFTTLVRKYSGLVYAAALRQSKDAHDAEEITQAVFVILARKSRKLPTATVLSGWLLRTTRFVALNARRKQLRRPPMEPVDPDLHITETDAAWTAMAPLLDEALVTLNESNRNAVSLRFFEGRSFKEIAELMGTSEDAAQKRVSRALDLLRTNFVKRGLILSSTLLVGAIGTHAIQAAPAQVIAGVCGAVGTGTAVSGSVPLLARLALDAMRAAQRRTIMLRIGAVALVVLVAFLSVLWMAPRELPVPLSLAGEAVAAKAYNNPPPANGAVDVVPGPGQVVAGGMLVRVADSENDTPIAHARVTVRQRVGFVVISVTDTFETDGNGECRLPVDRTPLDDWSFYVEILKDGYALQFANWSSARGDTVEDVPTKYRAGLVRSVTIGGMVLNEQGKPLSGAQLIFSVSGRPFSPELQREREGFVKASRYHTEFTDAEGRWRCDHAPPQFEKLTFTVVHPDCLQAIYGVAELGETDNPSLVRLAEKDFRQQTATMVLKPGLILKTGLIVSGSVSDEEGNPIAGAKVTQNRNWHADEAVHFTGADGRFRLANVAEGELVVTVEAAGFVATDKTIHPETQGEELRFMLAPAAHLFGRVVDETGAPVRAGVSAAGADFESRTPRFNWSTTTDAEGRFEWRSVPPAHTFYAIQAPDHETPERVELIADGTEQLITLRRRSKPPGPRISGIVTEDETGQPINNFQVWMGRSLAVQGPMGTTMLAELVPTLETTGEEGKFAFPCRDRATRYRLQVKADGYVAAELSIPGPLTNSCHFDFKLRKAELITGIVLTPEGTPAAGAAVMLCSEKARAVMNLPGQFNLATSKAAHTMTDADARFTLPSAAEAKQIIFAQTAGYAEVSCEKFLESRVITLQPWGRIEGTLKIGSRPGSGEAILVGTKPRLPTVAGLDLHLKVVSDSAGRFVIENVPPGEWQIAYLLHVSGAKMGEARPTQCTPIDLQAGQTIHVALGGTGWRVTGRIRSANTTEPINWQHDPQNLNLKSPDAQLARQYALVFDTNGVFTIDDVPPGTYLLNMVVTAPGSSGSMYDQKSLGILHQEITLPAMPSAQEVLPFDVGTLSLQPVGPR